MPLTIIFTYQIEPDKTNLQCRCCSMYCAAHSSSPFVFVIVIFIQMFDAHLLRLLAKSRICPQLQCRSLSTPSIIARNVPIISGGSSGTDERDMAKSVVVVESTDRLRGHAEAYIEPATQAPVDICVQA